MKPGLMKMRRKIFIKPKENHPQTFLIKNDLDINNFQNARYTGKCINLNLSPVELSNLLEENLQNNSFFNILVIF